MIWQEHLDHFLNRDKYKLTRITSIEKRPLFSINSDLQGKLGDVNQIILSNQGKKSEFQCMIIFEDQEGIW
jgi:hypothetical protein